MPVTKLSVTIQGFVDEHFPGFVQCVLADADGVEHQFLEKGPVVSRKHLSANSVYPQPGQIGCMIQTEWIDDRGHKLARVCTEQPWDVESVAGETNFTVFCDQIVRD
jgi:hypothetical protein